MKRRGFLGGALGAGALVVLLPGCSLPVIPRRPEPSLEDAAGWVAHQDGRFLLRLPRVEMGQNIATGFKRIACMELGADWDRVEVELLRTDAIARVKATVGSDSMRDFALPLARACATLRMALARGERDAVLTALELPPSALRSLTGAQGRADGKGPLVHGREIVTGKPLYAADVRLPGMAYGRVLRAPWSPELRSHPGRWDEATARRVAGFVALLRDDRLANIGAASAIAIVGATPGALDRIEAALAVQWRRDAEPGPAPRQALALDARLEAGSLDHVPEPAPVDAAMAWTTDLRMEVPLAAHAFIEPRAAVARWQDGCMDVWAGGQDPFYQRDAIARALGLDEAQVRLRAMRVGGAFGGKTLCTVELEAAVLAHRLGRPIKVQWTRAQEFAHGFHRPPSSHRVRARLDGRELCAWWHAFSTSHVLLPGAALPAWIQGGIAGLVGDSGAARGSHPPYRCAATRIEYQLTRLDALTGPWRGLGAGPNLLAMESAIDECARAAAVDPVAFRLSHIDDARLAEVIRRAAATSGWSESRPIPAGSLLRGRGFACGIYKGASYAAAVAEVEVDPATGSVRVVAIWCAHDCGAMIDPDQVRAQVEGNLVWCVGMVLVEELPFADGAVVARTFAEAPIPRYRDLGRFHVALVDSRAAPAGAGETAMVAGAGAIANAVRDATGWRPRRVPMRQNEVLAALDRGTGERAR